MGNIPFKIGNCSVCSELGKKLIAKKCFEGPNFCYQKSQQEAYKEKQSMKPKSKPQGIRKSNKDQGVRELLKLAIIVFNRAIRKRDTKRQFFVCISCNKSKREEEAQCGHFMPVVYSALRFEEDNCHAECEACNCHDPNHLVGYRRNLEMKIGYVRLQWLESHSLSADFKWTREYLLEIIAKYK